MIGTQTTWTTERIALLRNRIDAGFSCGQIAREIGVSRNAVIGKANRTRFCRASRAQTGNKAPERLRAPGSSPQHKKPPSVAGEAADCVRKGGRATALTAAHYSNFSSGIAAGRSARPGAEDFGFCGSKMVDGLPYCEAHARMAYRAGAGVVPQPDH